MSDGEDRRWANIVHPIHVTEPMFGVGCLVGPGAVLGIQPLATKANRRPVVRAPNGFIGSRCVIGANVVMYADVILGDDCRIGDFACIREGSRIGSRCVIGTNADLQYGVTVFDDVRIMNAAHIAGGTVIGAGSFIGPGVMTANHRNVDLNAYDVPAEGHRAPIIGEKVMIGVGAILLPGVKIGDGATIASGAMVTKDVAAGETVFGIPAMTAREEVMRRRGRFAEEPAESR